MLQFGIGIEVEYYVARIVSLTQAQEELAELLREMQNGGEPVCIVEAGQEVAVQMGHHYTAGEVV